MNLLTIIKIGWRNVWRNRSRSTVVVLSVIMGLSGGLLILSLMFALNDQRMDNAINTYLANIQVHDSRFAEEYSLDRFIDDHESIDEMLSKDKRVKAYSKRVIINGMLSNSTGSHGVNVLGVNPDTDINVSNVNIKLLLLGRLFEKCTEGIGGLFCL